MEEDKSPMMDGLRIGEWPLDFFHNEECVELWRSPQLLVGGKAVGGSQVPGSLSPASVDQLGGPCHPAALLSEKSQNPLLHSL